ncbi:hypothetical protein BKA93DRAFT_752492 [Sparassis latifolia]
MYRTRPPPNDLNVKPSITSTTSTSSAAASGWITRTSPGSYLPTASSRQQQNTTNPGACTHHTSSSKSKSKVPQILVPVLHGDPAVARHRRGMISVVQQERTHESTGVCPVRVKEQHSGKGNWWDHHVGREGCNASSTSSSLSTHSSNAPSTLTTSQPMAHAKPRIKNDTTTYPSRCRSSPSSRAHTSVALP